VTLSRREYCSNLAAIALAGPLATTMLARGFAQEGSRKNPYTQPHVLRFADTIDVTSLNPMFTQTIPANRLACLTMAWLTRYDRQNRLMPELATMIPTKANGGVSADGKTITFHLRNNAQWSDGVPFGAHDVVFSTKVILDPKTRVLTREGWDRIASVEQHDNYTVVYHLKEPFAPFSAIFNSGVGGPAILPKHLLEHTADINTDAYNANPIGIGPFRYVEWRRGDRILMEANERYFRGAPKLQRVEYRIVPSRDTLLLQLQTGEIDLWPNASAAYYPRLQALNNIVVLRQHGYQYGHLDFNLSRPILQDVRVRRALALAIDRETLKQKISHGLGVIQDGVWSPASPFFDPTIATTPFDIVRANALLEAAGWRRNGDYREKNGQPLTLELASTTGSPDVDTLIELVRSWWKSIGVEVERHDYDPALLFAEPQSSGIIFGGKFDVAMFSWQPNPTGDMARLYSCASNAAWGMNVPRWCNSTADAAMSKFFLTYDLDEQKRLNDIVQQQLVLDVPTFVLRITEDLFAMNSDLQNFHPNAVTAFDDMMDVDI
jgi:peptide/nickel transport system substrate-binding protein